MHTGSKLALIASYYGFGILLGKQYGWTVWQCIYFSTVTGEWLPGMTGGVSDVSVCPCVCTAEQQ